MNLRGAQGFGGHHQIHAQRSVSLASELPVIIEVLDARRLTTWMPCGPSSPPL